MPLSCLCLSGSIPPVRAFPFHLFWVRAAVFCSVASSRLVALLAGTRAKGKGSVSSPCQHNQKVHCNYFFKSLKNSIEILPASCDLEGQQCTGELPLIRCTFTLACATFLSVSDQGGFGDYVGTREHRRK